MDSILVKGKEFDLGGFSIHRSLPTAKKRSVGPFVFLDHMGPMQMDNERHLNVRPHPHIGLATVTYLYEGRGHHRDSLGSSQLITPGDINLMIAGGGIVHSERTPADDFDPKAHKSMHGIQIWLALPLAEEDCAPSFVHWPNAKLPELSLGADASLKLLMGEFQGAKSPVQFLSRTLFMDMKFTKDAAVTLSFAEKEMGFFLAAGAGRINAQELQVEELYIPSSSEKLRFEFSAGTRLVVIGGDPYPEPRYMWWNFVSSSKEKIRAAAGRWQAQSMGQVAGDPEFIPLPHDPLP